jgi:hypothetical protein
MHPVSWIARLQGVDSAVLQGLRFSNRVAILSLHFDTPVSSARRFTDFLGVCSNPAPIVSNFSSVSTWLLYFCFLSIESPIDLSLFTKLWIVCLLGTFSARNLCQYFRRHFLEDPYFMRCHTAAIHVALKYTAQWRNTLSTNCNWEQMANGADNCRPLLTNSHEWTALLSVKHNTVKRSQN